MNKHRCRFARSNNWRAVSILFQLHIRFIDELRLDDKQRVTLLNKVAVSSYIFIHSMSCWHNEKDKIV